MHLSLLFISNLPQTFCSFVRCDDDGSSFSRSTRRRPFSSDDLIRSRVLLDIRRDHAETAEEYDDDGFFAWEKEFNSPPSREVVVVFVVDD